MKLTYSLDTCAVVMHAQSGAVLSGTVTHVVYDSRKIRSADGALFFALSGANRTGTQFIADAYEKGIRWFVVPKMGALPSFPDAVFLHVDDVLAALQALAAFHRKQFSYPVVAITGSVGKTTFKEWMYHVLEPAMRVVRSPKSFNSQIGVALSLLELRADADIALIEAGISEPFEMERLAEMIQPTLGVFTTFGKAHAANFASPEEQLNEKLKLFRTCKKTFVSASIPLSEAQLASINGFVAGTHPLNRTWFTPGYAPLLGLVEELSSELGILPELFEKRLETLPQLALRMETFEGIHGNTIINDTYNLDVDALTEALHYQQQLAGARPRVVIIGLSETTAALQPDLAAMITTFRPDAVYFVEPGAPIPWQEIANSVVLVKGSRARGFEKEVSKGKQLKHRTVVEINLSAIRHNVQYFKKRLPAGTKILCMVKASSYGSGAERVAAFLQQENVDYFGVAFADEGVALREAGITLPIVVMNADPEQAGLLIQHQLEPAIFSFSQLDAFVTALIHEGKSDYPVHLKFDTGMHRLGFDPADKERVFAAVAAQPEIVVKGIYSHLADADNTTDNRFTLLQIRRFKEITEYFTQQLQYSFLAHLLNSEGALHYRYTTFDMIRLGIVLYGYPSEPALAAEMQPSVSWKSFVSQVRNIPAGDCVGYGCSFQAPEPMTIAVIPVGYADGFRRSLSNGKGAVYLHGKRCEVVGRVCMDMIMVNVTGLSVTENEEVEIIGEHQSMADFAKAMDTIPYEVMTGLSKRMHRVYVEE